MLSPEHIKTDKKERERESELEWTILWLCVCVCSVGCLRNVIVTNVSEANKVKKSWKIVCTFASQNIEVCTFARRRYSDRESTVWNCHYHYHCHIDSIGFSNIWLSLLEFSFKLRQCKNATLFLSLSLAFVLFSLLLLLLLSLFQVSLTLVVCNHALYHTIGIAFALCFWLSSSSSSSRTTCTNTYIEYFWSQHRAFGAKRKTE